MVSWAPRYAAPSRGHDVEPWPGVGEGKALEGGRCRLPARWREPAPVSEDGGKNRGIAARPAKVYRYSTGRSPPDTGSSETTPSAGAELRTARLRGHRAGTVRCSRWGGTAPAFRIVIAKVIGMKYLGSPLPAGGPRDLGVLVCVVRCAVNIAVFLNIV